MPVLQLHNPALIVNFATFYTMMVQHRCVDGIMHFIDIINWHQVHWDDNIICLIPWKETACHHNTHTKTIQDQESGFVCFCKNWVKLKTIHRTWQTTTAESHIHTVPIDLLSRLLRTGIAEYELRSVQNRKMWKAYCRVSKVLACKCIHQLKSNLCHMKK